MNWLKRYKSCILTASLISLIVGCMGGIFIGVDNQYGSSQHPPYYTIKPQIQNAVIAYIWDHDGERPPHAGTYNITTADNGYNLCDVIDICSLIGYANGLRNIPDGCYGEKGEAGTNFYSGECENYEEAGEYVWLMDDIGNVYSTCMGSDCEANNADGYQGAWYGYARLNPPYNWWSEHWKGAAALIAITVLVFFISLFFCIRYSTRHQPTDKPTDEL